MVKIAPDKSLPQTKNRGQWLTLTAIRRHVRKKGEQNDGLPRLPYRQ
jgi:hypothetical protein